MIIMSLECPICRKEIRSGRNHVFICIHASMPLGVVFTPDRSRYEWNCTNSSAIKSVSRSRIANFEILEEFKKPTCPIIFE
jgi:hypothetical protein